MPARFMLRTALRRSRALASFYHPAGPARTRANRAPGPAGWGGPSIRLSDLVS